MLKTINFVLSKAAKTVKKCRNVLENRTVFSLLAVFTTCLTIFMLTGLLYFRGEVIITDGDSIIGTLTALEEPEEILAEQGYTLGENDYYIFSGFTNNIAYLSIIRPDDVSKISEIAEIIEITEISEQITETTTWLSEETTAIFPALNINITADGIITKLAVKEGSSESDRTVKSLLEAAEITLSEDDLITPPIDEVITEDSEIVIRRVKYIERITVNTIPYATEYIESTLHTIGHSELLTAGINGSEQVTTREMLIDGEAASSTVIEVDITNEPVNEVYFIGTALAVPYSTREFDEIDLDNGLPAEYEFLVSGKACAYTAGPKAGTASGRKLEIGTVAVNPNIIPYGSLLYIVSQDGTRVYGAAVAADTGYLTDVVVDLYMGLTSEHYSDACNWGARQVDVYVINTGKY